MHMVIQFTKSAPQMIHMIKWSTFKMPQKLSLIEYNEEINIRNDIEFLRWANALHENTLSITINQHSANRVFRE